MTLELTPTQTKEKLITGEELWAMGSAGDLYELVEGRIIYMSPTGFLHGQYEVGISEKLNRFVRQHKLGKVVSGEVGVYITRNPDTIRAADVAYISKERYAQHDKSKGYLTVAPELVVEILSPDDRWNDVTQKMREYFSIGVKLMWIADPQSRRVYAYRSPTEAREFKASDTLTADDVLPGFSVPVDELFEE